MSHLKSSWPSEKNKQSPIVFTWSWWCKGWLFWPNNRKWVVIKIYHNCGWLKERREATWKGKRRYPSKGLSVQRRISIASRNPLLVQLNWGVGVISSSGIEVPAFESHQLCTNCKELWIKAIKSLDSTNLWSFQRVPWAPDSQIFMPVILYHKKDHMRCACQTFKLQLSNLSINRWWQLFHDIWKELRRGYRQEKIYNMRT